MFRTFGRTAALLAGTTALALAGCGDDGGDSAGGGDDAKEIEAVVAKALTTSDVEVKCVETVTEGFVTAVYGTLAQCRKAEAPEPDDDPKPDGATASGVQVDGDKATATITVKGGDSDGAAGEISFEKVDGDWKVSDLGISFLRSQLTTGLEKGTFDASDGALADPEVRSCIGKGLSALDDTTLKRVAYASISDQDIAPEFLKVVTECTAGKTQSELENGGGDDDTAKDTGDDGEQSLLRRQFESGIRQSAKKDDATDEQIDCVLKDLRTSISEDEIVAAVGEGADKVRPELSKKVAKAIQRCG